ncbi:hypothetical protein EC968_007596 [Mortierella alpina]|nr:hypothetical protein EC968_007596 [Mortierella alpina]
MFNEDSGYQGVIDKINKIHSHGLTHNLSIPQLAIIGDQSSGKSSVLEAITKLSFPRDKEMCTRFAIQVNLRRTAVEHEDVLSARIEGEDKFNETHKKVSPADFHDVIKKAQAELCKSTAISDKVLELTLSGPNQSPLTIIDLPGFINTTLDGQDKTLPDTIHAINRRYIKEPRTIILAVAQANVDLNTSRALSEAAEHDPDGERTIPIVTKPDRIENGLHADWVEVILNRRKFMKLGYLVMCNATHEQKTLSWEEASREEERFFSANLWSSVSVERKGRVAVKKFLGNLLYDHIRKELPCLRREVEAALDVFKRDLKAMGLPIADKVAAREKLNVATLGLLPQVKDYLNADYDHEYIAAFKNKPITSPSQDPYFVRSSLLVLYQEYRSAMSECNRMPKSDIVSYVARYKGNDLPGFVSFTTFKNIINGHCLDGWRSVTKEYVHLMHKRLSDALLGFIEYTADAAARDVFTHVFGRFSRDQLLLIEETIREIFEDESTPFTLSRHYQDTIRTERSKNKQVFPLPLDSSATDISKGIVEPKPQPPQSRAPNSPQPLETESPESPRPLQNSDWNDEHTTVEMIPCLRAYLSTARERIVDKVLMETIERHMIKNIKIYFEMLYHVTEQDLQCMLESDTLKRRRQDLETKISDFDNILIDL